MRSKTARKPLRRTLLAAPLVVTSAWSTACGGPTHTNPGPPVTSPTPQETSGPAPTASGSPGPGRPLAEVPKDGGGHVEKRPDGTCVYVFPPPDMTCPDDMACNPGPPREPLDVRCPEGTK
ncbi:MAG: hypothetical protein U0414_37360 [Polyangiaceae bacterium]